MKGKETSVLLVVLFLAIPSAKAGFGEFNDCVISAARSSPWPYVSDGSWRTMCSRISPIWAGSCYRYTSAGMGEKVNFCYNLLYDRNSRHALRAGDIESSPSGSNPDTRVHERPDSRHQENLDDET